MIIANQLRKYKTLRLVVLEISDCILIIRYGSFARRKEVARHLETLVKWEKLQNLILTSR